MHKCHIQAIKERIRIEKEEKEGSNTKTTTKKHKQSSSSSSEESKPPFTSSEIGTSSQQKIDDYSIELNEYDEEYIDMILTSKDPIYKFAQMFTKEDLDYNYLRYKKRFQYNMTHHLDGYNFIDTL
ncbi:Hypothetical protein SRAE_2000461300 [Strongyloides ratti]|uniref:Uncharacterized protein n=1 Tax=Strongyloides ratti TaxID=34506 RepID=A0A090LJF6_STRRB|nr:Hypothetical protein SRAE_2000461300 [Strongyloides ratti]CEF69967.1 Hypothetical protein SRAE_2000461300 [Strongyloides ratti]